MRATSSETLIIARTDAVAVEGFDRALARAALYREAGADMLFIEAPRKRDELGRIGALAANGAADGQYGRGRQNADAGGERTGEARLRFVIFPGGIVRALAKAAEEFYGSLKAHGSTEPFRAAHVRLRRAQRADRHAGHARARQASIESGRRAHGQQDQRQ